MAALFSAAATICAIIACFMVKEQSNELYYYKDENKRLTQKIEELKAEIESLKNRQ